MNKKGFTLIELLATLVVLGIVLGISIIGINTSIKNTKKKTEEVFIGTIKDAVKIYLDSSSKPAIESNNKVCEIEKALDKDGKVTSVYEYDGEVYLEDIISSKYSPLVMEDLKNPRNEKDCSVDAKVTLYRDDDYVYYYKISKEDLNCFEEEGIITNLPSECE